MIMMINEIVLKTLKKKQKHKMISVDAHFTLPSDKSNPSVLFTSLPDEIRLQCSRR